MNPGLLEDRMCRETLATLDRISVLIAEARQALIYGSTWGDDSLFEAAELLDVAKVKANVLCADAREAWDARKRAEEAELAQFVAEVI